jgi:Zn-dependent protease
LIASFILAEISTLSVRFAAYLATGLLVALVIHEYAHAFVALRLGDRTPQQAGRLTLNPQPHLDSFGSLLLPGILLLPVIFGNQLFPVFAYAKPQPLNPWALRRQDSDSTWIALAGPAANVALAFLVGLVLRAATTGELALLLTALLQVNVTLAVLNLVPVPGLDGSRVLARFLPARAREMYANADQYLALFILVIFFILPGPIFAFVRVVGNGICQAVAGGDCL